MSLLKILPKSECERDLTDYWYQRDYGEAKMMVVSKASESKAHENKACHES